MWLKLNVLIFFKNHTVSFLLAKTRKTKYLKKKYNNSLKFILKEDFFSTTGIMLSTSLFCK